MPISKRAKKVTLAKTSKRDPREKRAGYVDTLRAAIEAKRAVFAVKIGARTRATHFKQLRAALPAGSRLFLGKKSLMRVALGSSAEDEIRPNLHKLAASLLDGATALIATDASRADIDAALRRAATAEFATAGHVSDVAVTLESGPLPEDRFPASMRDELRKLGLDVDVKDAKLHLVSRDVAVATPGVALTPEHAKLLKHLDIKLDAFEPVVVAAWVDGDVSDTTSRD